MHIQAESNEQEKFTSPRKKPGFSDSALSSRPLRGKTNFPQNFKQSVMLGSASLFFVTRSLCFTMNNLYPLSISSATFRFPTMVKSTVLLICVVDFSCFVIFSVRCLRSLTPLRVQMVSPPNSRQG